MNTLAIARCVMNLSIYLMWAIAIIVAMSFIGDTAEVQSMPGISATTV